MTIDSIQIAFLDDIAKGCMATAKIFADWLESENSYESGIAKQLREAQRPWDALRLFDAREIALGSDGGLMAYSLPGLDEIPCLTLAQRQTIPLSKDMLRVLRFWTSPGRKGTLTRVLARSGAGELQLVLRRRCGDLVNTYLVGRHGAMTAPLNCQIDDGIEFVANGYDLPTTIDIQVDILVEPDH